MSSLSGTSLEFILRIFNVNTDEELISRMTWIGFWYTVSVGLYSFFFPAPYGRYASSKFGPTVNAKLAWMVQESPVVYVSLLIYLLTPAIHARNPANVVPLILLIIHYVNRSFVFAYTLSPKARPAPVLTMLSAFAFCIFNGLLQAHHLINVSRNENGVNTAVGAAVFVLGMAINIHHDNLLSKLRNNSDKGKKSSYQIPHGSLFKFVSGANYFGEIVEWWGLAIITQKPPQIVFAIFSTVFLGLRATHHHRFYKEQFGSTYPPDRKAVIPFIL